MVESAQRDVLVLGAGLVGLCTALALQEKGWTVRLVDRDEPGAGASYGNAGILGCWSCIPQSVPGLWKSVPKWLLDPEGPVALRWSYLPALAPWLLKFLAAGRAERLPAIADAMLALSRPSLDLYRQHLAGTGEENLVAESWSLNIYRSEAPPDMNGVAWRLRRERGGDVALLSAGELRDLEPALSPDYRWAVAVKDQGRARDPGRIGQVLADKVRAQGGSILRATVKWLQPAPGGDGVVVETDAGTLTAAKAVVTAGAWSARLLAPLGTRVPLEAERGYHVVFKEPGVSFHHTLSEAEGKFAINSMNMGLRVAGTAEFAGLDAPPDYRRAHALARQAKRLAPGLNADSPVEWMGARPASPDSVPFIGPVPGHPDILAGFGHGHLGLTQAPMTGRMLAGLLAGQPTNVDLAPYALDRFG